jgi:hypothetical protein
LKEFNFDDRKFKEGELKMKKLLVLLMVLGLATTAQAALSLNLSATTVGIGGSVTLDVVSDDSQQWTGWFVLSEDTYYWTNPLAANYSGSWAIDASAGDSGSATVMSGYPAVYTLQAAGTTTPAYAGTQFSIDITGVQLGTIYLALESTIDYSPIAPGLTLEVVPEPMTIALFGLGGLFLRRRK